MSRFILPLIAALCVILSSARAQEVEVVSDEIWLGSQLFTIDDLEALDRAVKLTPEQRDAAKELMQGAMAEARMLSLKARSQTGDQQAQDKDRQDVSKRFPELEAEVMTNLRDLLTPAQLEAGWAEFQRSRSYLLFSMAHQKKRLLYKEGDENARWTFDASPNEKLPDVLSMIERAKPSVEDRESIAIVVDRHKKAMDALLVRWREAFRDVNAYSAPNMYRKGSVSPEKYDEVLTLFFEVQKELMRTEQEVAKLLTEPAKSRFQWLRLRGFDPQASASFRRRPIVTRVTSIQSLTDEQRAAVRDIVAAYDRDLLQHLSKVMEARQAKFLAAKSFASPAAQFGVPIGSALFEFSRSGMPRLETQLRELLTPEQLRALESGLGSAEDLERAFARKRVLSSPMGNDEVDLTKEDWTPDLDDQDED